MQTFHFRAMNTDIYLAAEGQTDQLAEGFAKAQQFILESERRFTRFSEESELSQLNRAAGQWFRVSADMLSVLMLAQGYAEYTDGLFNPSILPDLERIGYDRSLDLIHAMDDEVPLNSQLPTRNRSPLTGLIIDPEESLVYLPEAMQLDLGGIAKGWIAEQAATLLSKYASACAVNAGGDMMLIGKPEGSENWEIELENPLVPDQVLADLKIPSGAVATSSIARRTWKQGDQLRHHLIDPRTGEPAQSNWVSVTVLAPHVDISEVFAKVLLIGGPQQAKRLLEFDPEIAYLAVDREGKIWGTQASLEYLHD